MSNACTSILVGMTSLVSEILLPSKTAKLPFRTMDYSGSAQEQSRSTSGKSLTFNAVTATCSNSTTICTLTCRNMKEVTCTSVHVPYKSCIIPSLVQLDVHRLYC